MKEKKTIRPFPSGLSTELDFDKNRFKLSYHGFSLNLTVPNNQLQLVLGFPVAGLFEKESKEPSRSKRQRPN